MTTHPGPSSCHPRTLGFAFGSTKSPGKSWSKMKVHLKRTGIFDVRNLLLMVSCLSFVHFAVSNSLYCFGGDCTRTKNPAPVLVQVSLRLKQRIVEP